MIYVIAAPDTSRVKIGYTDGHPYDRMKQLEKGSPVPLFLVAFAEGGKEEERFLHSRFDGYRVHREWVEYAGDVRHFVQRLCGFYPHATVPLWKLENEARLIAAGDWLKLATSEAVA